MGSPWITKEMRTELSSRRVEDWPTLEEVCQKINRECPRLEYGFIPTFFPQKNQIWSRKRLFRGMLANSGTNFFVYIKFFHDGEKLRAIVIGTSQIKKDPSYDSDVKFVQKDDGENAKRWLNQHGELYWSENILFIKSEEDTEGAARKLETKLGNALRLFGS